MSVEAAQGAFVVFEGMDGSGKSTLSKLVAERLGTTPFAFPTHGGEVGKLIRRAFAGEVVLNPDVLAYLMVADGLDHEPLIDRALTAGTPIVCDRHTTVSGWVYQLDVYTVDAILAIQQRGQFHVPDIIFLLDVPEAVAIERMAASGALNPLYESKDLAKVTTLRRRYLAYQFMHDNVILLDGTKPPTELAEAAVDIITRVMAAGVA